MNNGAWTSITTNQSGSLKLDITVPEDENTIVNWRAFDSAGNQNISSAVSTIEGPIGIEHEYITSIVLDYTHLTDSWFQWQQIQLWAHTSNGIENVLAGRPTDGQEATSLHNAYPASWSTDNDLTTRPSFSSNYPGNTGKYIITFPMDGNVSIYNVSSFIYFTNNSNEQRAHLIKIVFNTHLGNQRSVTLSSFKDQSGDTGGKNSKVHKIMFYYPESTTTNYYKPGSNTEADWINVTQNPIADTYYTGANQSGTEMICSIYYYDISVLLGENFSLAVTSFSDVVSQHQFRSGIYFADETSTRRDDYDACRLYMLQLNSEACWLGDWGVTTSRYYFIYKVGSNKIIGYEITNVSFSGWRMIIDLVGTDARETNWPGLPFTHIEDQYFLVNGTDAAAGYINEQWLNPVYLAAGEEFHYDIIEVPSGLSVLNPPFRTT